MTCQASSQGFMYPRQALNQLCYIPSPWQRILKIARRSHSSQIILSKINADFVIRHTSDQRSLKSSQRLLTRNLYATILPFKTGEGIKIFLHKQKFRKWIYHSQTCLLRYTKSIFSDWNKRTLISNSNAERELYKYNKRQFKYNFLGNLPIRFKRQLYKAII